MHEALETMRCSGLKLRVVDAHHDHGVDVVLGRHGQDHFLGSGGQMLLERLAREQPPGRLDDDVDPVGAPRDLRRVFLGGHGDPAARHGHALGVRRHILREDTHDGVVLQEISQVVVVEDVVDDRDLDIRAVR